LEIKRAKDLLNFLKQNGLNYKYWKHDSGLYDIHIFNLTLMNITFADFENFIDASFIINNNNFNFLHIFKTSSDIEIMIGDLSNHQNIELNNVRISWNKNDGLEILWREEK